MTDQEHAAAVGAAAKALEQAMSAAQAAGLVVGVKILPKPTGGFDVWEEINRPLGRLRTSR